MLVSERIADRLAGRAVLVVGRAGMDIYPVPDGTRIEDAAELVTDVGGSSGNIAVSIAKQGCGVMLMAALSQDGVGRFVDRSLTQYGVDTRYCLRTEGLERTSLALAESTTDRPDVVIYRNDAADLAITADLADQVDLDAIGAVIITGTALSREPSRGACEQLLARARAEACPVILDLDYRVQAWRSTDEARDILMSMARRVDMPVGNDEEFDLIAGGGKGRDMAVGLAGEGALVLYKMGEGGCDILEAGTSTHVGIFRVTPLKPFGSGDAFLGTLTAALAGGADIEAAVTRGAAAAAIAVSRRGCARAMPDAGEIDALMATTPMTTTEAPSD
ncbi:MAG: PfkB family carbohydrate kinase [Candidatus Puniceispirillaceae bacterium]